MQIERKTYPVFLIKGAKMNHSCNPNIIFYEKDDKMVFESCKTIKKGEELCYSYLRNNTDINHKQYLIDHYNFSCECKI